MRRVHAALCALGPAGVVALGILAFCVPLYFSALVPAQQELDALRAGTARAAPNPDTGAEDGLARFQANFPPTGELADELERVYRLARAAGLDLMQGEYRAERVAAGLVPYRIGLPVRGTYPQLRQFVGALLAEVPFASLDALRFERRKSAESQLEAQVRVTVYFRAEDGR